MIYHVYAPKGNDAWRRNLWQLRRRVSIFNGKKIVAIASDETTEKVSTVRAAIGFDCHVLRLPNNPGLREQATFIPLMEAVETADPTAAIYYAHTKGTANKQFTKAIEAWRNAMYSALLDGQEAMDSLTRYPCVGCCKVVWGPTANVVPYPTALRRGEWTFAGTFWWFRAMEVFTHPEWRRIPKDTYAVEAYLPGLFPVEYGLSLVQPWPETMYPNLSPYFDSAWPEPITDPSDYEAWMHPSTYTMMEQFCRRLPTLYGHRPFPLQVLDVGSCNVNGSYRPLFDGQQYTGLDIHPGPGVDLVAFNPYRWTEIMPESFDLVISGQTLEHVEYPWETMREISRVLRPGGYAFIIVPSRGAVHRYPLDTFRYNEDGMAALGKWAGLEIVEQKRSGDPEWDDLATLFRKTA